jgi:hypothetical protein
MSFRLTMGKTVVAPLPHSHCSAAPLRLGYWRGAHPVGNRNNQAKLQARVRELEAEVADCRRQDRLLQQIIAHAPVGIAVPRGPEHRFTLVNPEQNSMEGSSARRWRGMGGSRSVYCCYARRRVPCRSTVADQRPAPLSYVMPCPMKGISALVTLPSVMSTARWRASGHHTGNDGPHARRAAVARDGRTLPRHPG